MLPTVPSGIHLDISPGIRLLFFLGIHSSISSDILLFIKGYSFWILSGISSEIFLVIPLFTLFGFPLEIYPDTPLWLFSGISPGFLQEFLVISSWISPAIYSGIPPEISRISSGTPLEISLEILFEILPGFSFYLNPSWVSSRDSINDFFRNFFRSSIKRFFLISTGSTNWLFLKLRSEITVDIPSKFFRSLLLGFLPGLRNGFLPRFH